MNSKDIKPHFDIIRFIFEVGVKLEVGPLTVATAACIYHKFFQLYSPEHYDQHLVAAVAIYLAGKTEEDQVRIRNVINVCYKIINKAAEPLGLGEEYWGLRDSLVQMELLVLRALRFKVHFEHPHKYLLHYLLSLSHWLHPSTWASVPLMRASWAFIHDLLHESVYLSHRPAHIAVAAIYLAVQSYGVEIPYANEAEVPWYQVFCEDLSEGKLGRIVKDIMNMYRLETCRT